MIRVGNEEYARDNASYGLDDHAERRSRERFAATAIKFNFRGKSGVEHGLTVNDKRLAKIVRGCQEIPGHDLFNYIDDDGKPVDRSIRADVNAYIREISGADFTAKDFRTWEATMACALELARAKTETAKEAKTAVVEAIKTVAKRLGNTPSVCKKAYILPAIIDEFLATGTLKKIETESQALAFIERLSSRDDGKHLTKLLRKSVQAKKAQRAA